MHPALSDNSFILKRYGRISAGTYRLYGLRHRDPLLYVDETVGVFPEPTVNRIYEDEEQLREVLTLTDMESTGVEMEVADPESGEKLGRIAMAVDDLGDYVEGTWSISDAENRPLGKILAKNTARPVAQAMSSGARPQVLDVAVGGAIVGEFRQKVNVVGYELLLDFSMDVARLLDRRLGLAAAVFAALDQGRAE